jgi:hypothetical protein
MEKYDTIAVASERMEDFKNHAPISLVPGNFVKGSIQRGGETLLSR